MPAKILVVDDEPMVERLISQRFRKQIRKKTYEFVFAQDGIQALEILQEHEPFDIILCDINMPGMDGITLLSKLNKMDLVLRTIMVSAYGDMKNIRATMNLGAYDFVTKPIDFEDLEITIKKTMKEVETLRQAAMAVQLEEQNLQLSQLDELKTRLFTNISHELRTPLTIITGMADQIKEEPQQWLSKGLVMIKRNSNNLLNLVNQILDLRKLEMGKMTLNYKQADIIHYLKYVAESFQSLAEQKDIRLQFSGNKAELIMDYDPEKILRIVSNLLSNAVKFTPEGGEVHLKVTHYPEGKKDNKEQLELNVQDTGIGIPKEKLPAVFSRFYQVEEEFNGEERKHLQKEQGTGIGLTIVKELMTMMEGEIEVESETGKGTTFSLFLPVHRNAAIVTSPVQKDEAVESTAFDTSFSIENQMIEVEEGSDELPSLLIVEDNTDVKQYLAACLQGRYRLYFAGDGQEGIDKALELVPDVIISDVMMPVKDGYEVCATLKSDSRTSHIPIILLTAKADDDARISGLEKGADAYLSKPFNKEELFVRLNKLLELRAQLQEKYRALDEPITAQNQEDEFIKRIREEIEANLDDEFFGIQELCRAIGMSRAQLHRKLKALTGKSTSIFVRSIRLHKAKPILLNTDLNISQVAFEVGFSDPKYFSRTFNEEFGMTPKVFRKEAGKQQS